MGRAFTAISAYEDASGAEIWIEYNDANLRITDAFWIVPAGATMSITVWEDGTPVFQQTAVGPESASTNVAGNRRMREVTDAGGTYLDFPANIEYAVRVTRQA
jgi:hypothetical protein